MRYEPPPRDDKARILVKTQAGALAPMTRAVALLAILFTILISACSASELSWAPKQQAFDPGAIVSARLLSEPDPAVTADAASTWRVTHVSRSAFPDSFT